MPNNKSKKQLLANKRRSIRKQKRTTTKRLYRQQGGWRDELFKTYLLSKQDETSMENIFKINIYDIKLIAIYLYLNKKLTKPELISILGLDKLDQKKVITESLEKIMEKLNEMELDEKHKIVKMVFVSRGNNTDLEKYLMNIDGIRDENLNQFIVKYFDNEFFIKKRMNIDDFIKELNDDELLPPIPTHRPTGLRSSAEKHRRSNSRLSRKLNINSVNELIHYHFTNWPDHGVPDINQYKELVKLVYNDIVERGGTTVIHCSAGVGRTGVLYITLKLMFVKNIKPNMLGISNSNLSTIDDIIDAIGYARVNIRQTLVQGITQLMFLANIFGIETKKISDAALAKFNGLGDFGTGAKYEQDDGKNPMNKAKNRYSNILPYDVNRVRLSPPIGTSDYINASLAVKEDGFSDNIVILSQCPKVETIPDFHQMLAQYNVKRIVNLTKDKELKGSVETAKCDGEAYKLAIFNNIRSKKPDNITITTGMLKPINTSGRASPNSSFA
jgi:protein tyrosine phosphatase